MTEKEGFYTRLAKAQAEFTNAVLDESNEYDRYKYASYGSLIAAARPALNAANIAVLHSIEATHELPNLLLKGKGPNVAVRTVLQADDGAYDAGVVSVPVRGRSLKGGGEGPVDAQAYGAAITYAKRYGMELALGHWPRGRGQHRPAAATSGTGAATPEPPPGATGKAHSHVRAGYQLGHRATRKRGPIDGTGYEGVRAAYRERPARAQRRQPDGDRRSERGPRATAQAMGQQGRRQR